MNYGTAKFRFDGVTGADEHGFARAKLLLYFEAEDRSAGFVAEIPLRVSPTDTLAEIEARAVGEAKRLLKTID